MGIAKLVQSTPLHSTTLRYGWLCKRNGRFACCRLYYMCDKTIQDCKEETTVKYEILKYMKICVKYSHIIIFFSLGTHKDSSIFVQGLGISIMSTDPLGHTRGPTGVPGSTGWEPLRQSFQNKKLNNKNPTAIYLYLSRTLQLYLKNLLCFFYDLNIG